MQEYIGPGPKCEIRGKSDSARADGSEFESARIKHDKVPLDCSECENG